MPRSRQESRYEDEEEEGFLADAEAQQEIIHSLAPGSTTVPQDEDESEPEMDKDEDEDQSRADKEDAEDDEDSAEDSQDDADDDIPDIELSEVLTSSQLREDLQKKTRAIYQRELDDMNAHLVNLERQEEQLKQTYQITTSNITQLQANLQAAHEAGDSAAVAQYTSMMTDQLNIKTQIEQAYWQGQQAKQEANNYDPILSSASYQKHKDRFDRLVNFEDLPKRARDRLERKAEEIASMYDPREKQFWTSLAAIARQMGLAPSGPQDQFHTDNPNYLNRSKKMTKGGPPVGSRGTGRSAPLSEKAVAIGRAREEALRMAGYVPGDAQWKKMTKVYQKWDRDNRDQ